MFIILIRFLPAILLVLLCSTVSFVNASGEEAVAMIIDVTYQEPVPEGELFNLTVSIQSFSNTSEMFLVRIVRGPLFSVQKEIIIPERSVRNLTFELKLLLSGDMRVELFFDDELIDFRSLWIEVPTPRADIGVLLIELVQVEVTATGVGLAALAIFASLFIQARHNWLIEEAEFIKRLKEQEKKAAEKKKKDSRMYFFLAPGRVQ